MATATLKRPEVAVQSPERQALAAAQHELREYDARIAALIADGEEKTAVCSAAL